MKDLFYREQSIYEKAVSQAMDIHNGSTCAGADYCALVNEYGKLLRLSRRLTKISDRTTDNLNASKLDLLDKIHYDALTGIYNRRFMEDNLKRIIKSISRSGDTLSVLMIDVDFFKQFNDIYGHSKGDACLKAVANALVKGVSRADDFVARYGGEEFIAVLPNTGEQGARYIASRLLENVRACNIPHEKSTAADCVTISIGVTAGDAKHTQNGIDYINQADKALYMSKQGGRNRYTFVTYKEVCT